MTESSTDTLNSNDNKDDIKPETLQDYQNDSTTIPLPDINMAMHPGQVCFGNNVSDETMFNERFIESRVHEGMNTFVLYLAAMMHNAIFVTVFSYLIYDIVNSSLELSDLIFSLLVYAFAFIGPYFAFKIASLTPVRFNRQAQVIHYPLSKNEVLTIPWRQAKPYMRLGRVASGSHNLMLIFPDPRNPGDPNNPNIIETACAFDSSDYTVASGIYERLEFIRGYMEKGLDAIQPCQELIDGDMVHKPTGYEKPMKFKDHPFLAPLFFIFRMFFYILGTGPLVDLWVKKQVRNFKWPDEVVSMCAEGAELSGMDTKPVKAQTERFYEFHGISDLIYVDKNGRRVG